MEWGRRKTGQPYIKRENTHGVHSSSLSNDAVHNNFKLGDISKQVSSTTRSDVCPKCGKPTYGFVRVKNFGSGNQLKKGCTSCQYGLSMTDRLF